MGCCRRRLLMLVGSTNRDSASRDEQAGPGQASRPDLVPVLFRCARSSFLLASSAPIQRLASGLLERVGAVGQAVAGDLPEEDPAKPLLPGPLGLEGDRF